MDEAFTQLGSVHTLVVCSDDGLDEISLAEETLVSELKNDVITDYRISPEQFGMQRQPLASLVVNSANESLDLIRSVLGGGAGPASDMVALNAGATIYSADLVDSLEAGVVRAQEILSAGTGLEKLEALVAFTQRFSETN